MEFQDIIAASVTGARVQRRKLYTDKSIEQFNPPWGLIVTTRTGRIISRADLAERSLPIFVSEMDDLKRKSDAEIVSDVLSKRDGVLTYLALQAWKLRSEILVSPPSPLRCRFVDFGRILWKLYGDLDVVDAWSKAIALLMSEADPFVRAILKVVSESGEVSGAPTELISKLQSVEDIPFMGGGKAISRRLREITPALEMAGMKVESKRYGNTTRWRISLMGVEDEIPFEEMI